jgi:hypothetical protein
MGLSFSDVNVRGSFTWVKCNDDAKSKVFRQLFTSKHGGEFIRKDNKFWEWVPSAHQMIEIDPSPPPELPLQENAKTWIFKDPDGKEIKTQNIIDFCKRYDLTRSSVYDIISKKRKHHKGYTFIEILNDDPQ